MKLVAVVSPGWNDDWWWAAFCECIGQKREREKKERIWKASLRGIHLQNVHRRDCRRSSDDTHDQRPELFSFSSFFFFFLLSRFSYSVFVPLPKQDYFDSLWLADFTGFFSRSASSPFFFFIFFFSQSHWKFFAIFFYIKFEGMLY